MHARARAHALEYFLGRLFTEHFPKRNTPARGTQRRRDRAFFSTSSSASSFHSNRRARDASSGRKTRRPASGH
jgi:hypothetical protein